MIGNSATLIIAIAGLIVLAALATVVGTLEAHARDGAWRRIADARRITRENERTLAACLDSEQCRDCPTWRHLRDRGIP